MNEHEQWVALFVAVIVLLIAYGVRGESLHRFEMERLCIERGTMYSREHKGCVALLEPAA